MIRLFVCRVLKQKCNVAMIALFWSLNMFSVAAETESQIVITCPAIMRCMASESAQKVYAKIELNQQSYECFQNVGEISFATQAMQAKTKCQAIYAADTATINKSLKD